MRLSPEDVRSRPEAPARPPASRSWRLELAMAVVGLCVGLAVVLWFLA